MEALHTIIEFADKANPSGDAASSLGQTGDFLGAAIAVLFALVGIVLLVFQRKSSLTTVSGKHVKSILQSNISLIASVVLFTVSVLLLSSVLVINTHKAIASEGNEIAKSTPKVQALVDKDSGEITIEDGALTKVAEKVQLKDISLDFCKDIKVEDDCSWQVSVDGTLYYDKSAGGKVSVCKAISEGVVNFGVKGTTKETAVSLIGSEVVDVTFTVEPSAPEMIPVTLESPNGSFYNTPTPTESDTPITSVNVPTGAPVTAGIYSEDTNIGQITFGSENPQVLYAVPNANFKFALFLGVPVDGKIAEATKITSTFAKQVGPEETILATYNPPRLAPDWGQGDAYVLTDGAPELASAHGGDYLNFYLAPINPQEYYYLELKEGHWSIEQPFANITDDPGESSRTFYDLKTNGYCYSLLLTDELLATIRSIPAQGWGGTFVLNGKNISCSQVTITKNTINVDFQNQHGNIYSTPNPASSDSPISSTTVKNNTIVTYGKYATNEDIGTITFQEPGTETSKVLYAVPDNNHKYISCSGVPDHGKLVKDATINTTFQFKDVELYSEGGDFPDWSGPQLSVFSRGGQEIKNAGAYEGLYIKFTGITYYSGCEKDWYFQVQDGAWQSKYVDVNCDCYNLDEHNHVFSLLLDNATFSRICNPTTEWESSTFNILGRQSRFEKIVLSATKD
ncbi:MAG: hypothetical protein Q4E88_02340 [Coriobacteriia bacterium]|nr:hypothetical protein [Coriobacteriia bacterium]